MGWWYWLGVSVGLGAAVGVLLSGLAPFGRRAILVSLNVTVVAAIAWIVLSSVPWYEGYGGLAGAVLALVGAPLIVWGAVRRGATPLGIALILTSAALVTAGLAFVPVVGYLEAVALPAFAARLRRRQPERYAGLRTLAKD